MQYKCTTLKKKNNFHGEDWVKVEITGTPKKFQLWLARKVSQSAPGAQIGFILADTTSPCLVSTQHPKAWTGSSNKSKREKSLGYLFIHKAILTNSQARHCNARNLWPSRSKQLPIRTA
jgi:hypothetical protein